MAIEVERKCREFGLTEGCLGAPDDRYTARFDDIGEEPLFWCSHCGPEALAMHKAIEAWIGDEKRTQEDLKWLDNMITDIEQAKLADKKNN